MATRKRKTAAKRTKRVKQVSKGLMLTRLRKAENVLIHMAGSKTAYDAEAKKGAALRKKG